MSRVTLKVSATQTPLFSFPHERENIALGRARERKLSAGVSLHREGGRGEGALRGRKGAAPEGDPVQRGPVHGVRGGLAPDAPANHLHVSTRTAQRVVVDNRRLSLGSP